MNTSQIAESQIAEMPIIPKSGEIMLYLSLNEITNMTPWDALKLAESLGFKLQLRYRAWQEDGVQKVGIYALLHYEQRDFDSALEPNYLERELEALWTQIQPSIAVNFAIVSSMVDRRLNPSSYIPTYPPLLYCTTLQKCRSFSTERKLRSYCPQNHCSI
jgi:hypothetical protein